LVLVLRSPRGRTTLVARSIVVTRSIIVAGSIVIAGSIVVTRARFAALLPWSHIALSRGSTLLPGLHVTVVGKAITATGTGFNATGLVFARSTTRQFVHQLLSEMSV
jgi:hypothetical protein